MTFETAKQILLGIAHPVQPHDPGHVAVAAQSGAPTPAGTEVHDHSGVTVQAHAGSTTVATTGGAYQDVVESEPVRPAYVEVHDHSRGNPENWGPKEWIDAIKENPTKYLKLFSEMAATGKLSDEAEAAKPDITKFAQTAVQELSEGIQLQSNMSAAFHSMAMSAINNIRA